MRSQQFHRVSFFPIIDESMIMNVDLGEQNHDDVVRAHWFIQTSNIKSKIIDLIISTANLFQRQVIDAYTKKKSERKIIF